MLSKKRGKDLLGLLTPSSKRGQGLSLNVIIIAALALIVLVVMIAIFLNQATDFEENVSQETRLELIKLRTSEYERCRPSESAEESFALAYGRAESPEDKQSAKDAFRNDHIKVCSLSEDEATCGSANCRWS
jgi:cell division protein FtsN